MDQVTFPRSVQRRSWRPGENYFLNGEALFPRSLCPSTFSITCAMEVYAQSIHFSGGGGLAAVLLVKEKAAGRHS